MSVYADLPKLGRIKLPSGSEYALTDADLRLMVAPHWSAGASYAAGDYVRYDSTPFTSSSANPFNSSDDLYKCITANSDSVWNPAKWELVTIADELKNLYDTITGGITFRGKTTSSLVNGATTNPIVVGGQSYTAVAGDLVIETPPTYAASTEYHTGEYFKKDGVIYQVEQDFTSPSSGDLPSSEYINIASSEPEFIFDGTYWNEFGSFNPAGLGDLAYKNTATGSYTKPTGSGSVTVNDYSATTTKLVTTTITPTNGTESVSKMTAGTAINVASAGTPVRYGTADVGSAVTYGTANKATTATTVGNANVGAAVVYGNADVGSSVTVAVAGAQVVYGNADVGTEVTYGSANCGSTVTGIAKVGSQKTFATGGITSTVDGDCLIFSTAGTSTVIGVNDTTGVSITPAVQSTSKLTPAKAADTSRKLTPVGSTTTISPAVSADTSRTLTPAILSTTSIYGAVDSTSTLTPAVAAPNTQTVTPAVANGTITPWTESAKTVAKVAANAITVATGTVASDGTGATLVSAVTPSASSKTVTVGTTTDTITVH